MYNFFLAVKQDTGYYENMKNDLINKILRHELNSCGKRRSIISRETGLNESILSRFLYGASITGETASVLLVYFGYEIKKRKPKTKGNRT